MSVFAYFIKSITAKRRRRILIKQLDELKLKLEVKKILECALISTCKEPDCPFIALMDNYDKIPE